MTERITTFLKAGESIKPIPKAKHGSQEWAYGSNFVAIEESTHEDGNSVVIDIDIRGATEPVIIEKDIALSVNTMQGQGLAVIYNTKKKSYVRLVELKPGQKPLTLEYGDAYFYLNTGEEKLVLRDDSTPAFQDGDELSLYPALDKQDKRVNSGGEEQRDIPEGWTRELPTIFLRAYALAKAGSRELGGGFFNSRGAGIIFHIKPTDEFMFFLRDDKPSISCPNMIDIIGGHMEEGETPEDTARREVTEELINDNTGEPFEIGSIEHFMTFIDDRPGEHNIFGCELDYVPNVHIEEGQGLVRLTREQVLDAPFAYNYNDVVQDYVRAH
jgi:8-oxo-dGTP diphosphatase